MFMNGLTEHQRPLHISTCNLTNVTNVYPNLTNLTNLTKLYVDRAFLRHLLRSLHMTKLVIMLAERIKLPAQCSMYSV